jgi:phage terminase small subunit
MAGRPRKPTRILELTGRLKHDPQRRRPAEPKVDGPLGEPPGRLPAEIIPFWQEIVSIAADGVLTKADRIVVELAARLMERATRPAPSIEAMAKVVDAGEIELPDLKALLQLEKFTSADMSNLRALLSSIGLDPASRSKLSVAQAKPKNPFADLAEEAQIFVVNKSK